MNTKYEYSFETRSYELNVRDELKPTQLIQYLQETAEHQIHDQDRDYTELYNVDRKAFIISRMNLEIYRPIHRYAKVTAHTWITEGRAANFPRNYDLYCDGELVALATSNWALVDVDSRKLIRFSDYDTANYSFGDMPELSIPSRFRIPSEVAMHKVSTFSVGYSMTDINRHMNNAIYINELYDLIPEIYDRFITSVNVRYVREAVLGSEVSVYKSDILEPAEVDPRADGIIYFKTETASETNIEAVFGIKSNI